MTDPAESDGEGADITARLDALYAEQPSRLDPVLAAIQAAVIAEDW